MPKLDNWCQSPIIYEVYPRSFNDTTGSGEGDLNGITEKLPYIAKLGVDAIWLAPFFRSPMIDGGYDVSAHHCVNPRFGTLDDFDRLVETAHNLDLRVIIDQVLNHTSDQHEWFQKSIADEDGYADWYIWKDPKPDGTAPNNWLSQFGKPAWTYNHKRRQYYLHQFLECQPSLNLRNPEVQDAHAKEMAFWRQRGIDGFRIDAVSSFLCDELFKDNPPARPEVRKQVVGDDFIPYTYQDHKYDIMPDDSPEYVEKLRTWAGADLYLLGEVTVGNRSIELIQNFTGPEHLNACYSVDLIDNDLTPAFICSVLDRVDGNFEFGWWLSSHDQPRHITREDHNSPEEAKFLAMLMAVMPGPWMVYQGEEWGLPAPDLTQEETTDPLDLLYWPDGPGREKARVPLPWDSDKENYGFTSGKPWLPMRWNPGMSHNEQVDNPESVLNFYKKLIELRQDINLGGHYFESYHANNNLLTLKLINDNGSFLICFNFGDNSNKVSDVQDAKLLLTTRECENNELPARTGAIWQV